LRVKVSSEQASDDNFILVGVCRWLKCADGEDIDYWICKSVVLWVLQKYFSVVGFLCE
jgi:hypothetical protein